jgi:predicted nucleic acid-binding protein
LPKVGAEVVIDSSFIIAVSLREPDVGDDAIERLGVEGALVPALWRFEVANALLMAVRRKRIVAEDLDRILAELMLLNLREDDRGSERAWTATLALARAHGLASYDAAYLELALRSDGLLATFDRALAAAAAREGVEVLQ